MILVEPRQVLLALHLGSDRCSRDLSRPTTRKTAKVAQIVALGHG